MRQTSVRLILVVLVLLLLAGVWFFLNPWSPTDTGAEPAVSDSSPRINSPPLSPGRDEANAPSGTERAEPKKENPELPNGQAPEDETRETATNTTEEGTEGVVIDGKLLDDLTEQEIPGATVALGYPNGDRKKFHYSKTDDEGRFRFALPELNAIPEGATLSSVPDGYEYTEAQPAHTGVNVIRRKRITTILVRLEGATCLPENTWLRWADDTRPQHETFDPETHEARFLLRNLKQPGKAAACINWFGTLIESGLIDVELHCLHRVTLEIPPGASLRLRVIGPGALPMKGVTLYIETDGRRMETVTPENGEVLLEGVPAPASYEIRPVTGQDGVFCVPAREVQVPAPGDLVDVPFDFSGCSIVDCKLSIRGEALTWFHVSSVNDDSIVDHTIRQYKEFGGGRDFPRIYGLPPGRYRVVVRDWDSKQDHTAEFDASPPPETSNWHRDFRTFTLTVRLQGAAEPGEMELHLFNGKRWAVSKVRIAGAGVFDIRDLSGDVIKLRVSGGGYASRIVEVNPTEVSELDLPVTPSGNVRFSPIDGQMQSLVIEGPLPDTASFKYLLHDGSKQMLELAPGRYKLSGRGWKSAPWKPVEFAVVAGQEVEVAFGPEYTTCIEMRTLDGSRMKDLQITLTQAGVTVETNLIPSIAGSDEVYSLMFVGQGLFSLTITGEGINDFTKEVEVARGETLKLVVDLDRKR